MPTITTEFWSPAEAACVAQFIQQLAIIRHEEREAWEKAAVTAQVAVTAQAVATGPETTCGPVAPAPSLGGLLGGTKLPPGFFPPQNQAAQVPDSGVPHPSLTEVEARKRVAAAMGATSDPKFDERRAQLVAILKEMGRETLSGMDGVGLYALVERVERDIK